MWPDITVYQNPFLLDLPQLSGEHFLVKMPSVAEQDAPLLAMWLHGKAEKTQRAYAKDINKLYEFTGKSIRHLTLQDFQQFTDSLAHLKISSRARTTAAIKSVLTFLSKAELIPANVGAVVKLPELENTLAERIMSDRLVYRMIDGEPNPRNHAILTLLYYGGLRAAELCNLQWRHLQDRDETGQIAVYGKGKKTRFILLDEETWQEVISLHRENDAPDIYVFRSRQKRSRTNRRLDNERLSESMIYIIVSNAAKRVGIQGNVSPHWMRHAHATHALERGALITEVQADLGHKSIQTTVKYTHIRPKMSTASVLRGPRIK